MNLANRRRTLVDRVSDRLVLNAQFSKTLLLMQRDALATESQKKDALSRSIAGINRRMNVLREIRTKESSETVGQSDNDLNVVALRKFAYPPLRKWVQMTSKEYGVEEHVIWTGMTKALRKAMREAAFYFSENHGYMLVKDLRRRRKSFRLPVIVASPYPFVGVIAISDAWKNRAQQGARQFDLPSILLGLKEPLLPSGTTASHLLAEELKARLKGTEVIGSSLPDAIAIDDEMLRGGFEDALTSKKLTGPIRELLSTIAREVAAAYHPYRSSLEEQVATDLSRPFMPAVQAQYNTEEEFGLGKLEQAGAQYLGEHFTEVFDPLLRRLKKRRKVSA